MAEPIDILRDLADADGWITPKRIRECGVTPIVLGQLREAGLIQTGQRPNGLFMWQLTDEGRKAIAKPEPRHG